MKIGYALMKDVDSADAVEKRKMEIGCVKGFQVCV